MSKQAETGSGAAFKTQADIRELWSKIRSAAHHQRLKQAGPGNTEITRSTTDLQASIVPNVQNTPMEPEDAFAQEIFLQHTNIAHIAADMLPARSEKTRQKQQLILYRKYVRGPIERISDPFHVLRFESRLWEGLFRMARTLPLGTKKDYRALEEKLARSGINKLCFVDMSRNNIVLRDQQRVLTTLQTRFNNWSGKLRKLSVYLQDCQSKRESKAEKERAKLMQQIKKHSNLKDKWHYFACFADRILSELVGPKDRRTLFLWDTFAFDEDTLNRQYFVGKYFRVPEGQMPMNLLLENISRPEVTDRPHATHTGSDSSSDRSTSSTNDRPTPNVFAKPKELSFVPYDSSTQNKDASDGGHTPATPVRRNHTPEVSADRSNARSKQSAASSNRGNLDDEQQEAVEGPPAKRARSDGHTYAEQPEQQPMTTDSQLARVSETTSADAEPEGYSFEYVRSHTTIYVAVIQRMVEKLPHKPLTASIVTKAVKQCYDFYQKLFAQSLMPRSLRKLTDDERSEMLARGPLAWSCEQLNIPTIVEGRDDPSAREAVAKSNVEPVTPIRNASPPERAVEVEPDRHRRGSQEQTAEQREVEQQNKMQGKKTTIFPRACPVRPHQIVYEGDTPPRPHSSQPASDANETPPIESTQEAQSAVVQMEHVVPLISLTQDQQANSTQDQREIPVAKDPLAMNTQQSDNPAVDTMSEPNNDTFRPFVSSTQKGDTDSQQQQMQQQDQQRQEQQQEKQQQEQQELQEQQQQQQQQQQQVDQPESHQEEEESLPTSMEAITPAQVATSPPMVPENDSPRSPVKQEQSSSMQEIDCSGYVGYVEEIPWSPQIYTIDDSIDDSIEYAHSPASVANPIQNRLDGLFKQNEDATDKHEKFPGQLEPLSSEAHTCAQQMETFVTGWQWMVEGKHRSRIRPSPAELCFGLVAENNKPFADDKPPPMIKQLSFDFLFEPTIDSIRHTNRPVRWCGCNELQQNRLTVNLHHRTGGIFNVSVHDYAAGQLFGLLGPHQQTSAGWEALSESLAHVGKFRYGRNEPTKQYYRMTMAEKVLHLFFDSLPSFPHGGGFVLGFGCDRSSFPSHGGTAQLEPFNVHLHGKRQRSPYQKQAKKCIAKLDDGEGEKVGKTLYMPAVAEAMAKLRASIERTERS